MIAEETTASTAADAGLARVRSSLLLLAQTGTADLSVVRRDLYMLSQRAADQGRAEIAVRAAACLDAVADIAEESMPSAEDILSILDQVARIEACVFQTPLHSAEFISDVEELLDLSFASSFERVSEPDQPPTAQTVFEIDDEIYEIFRGEAEDLLAIIKAQLDVLTREPSNKAAVWEIRRAAHTFKGSAAIVGLTPASKIAHRMEDLLDRLVEQAVPAAPELQRFLSLSASELEKIVRAQPPGEKDDALQAVYDRLIAGETQDSDVPETQQAPVAAQQYSTPVVRASLDRLNELLAVSRQLIRSHADLASAMRDADTDLSETLLAGADQLSRELQAKLQQIRMVKFGTLETRLNRTVQATCSDEGKKTAVVVENGQIEIDTLVIDALIEPLLHILKNAVVHGIEVPETRRLIGKSETGTIRVRIEADEEALVLSVADDGGGIQPAKLKEKAIARGLLDTVAASALSSRDALKLIFEKGLTTAKKVDLNAGRGIGMSIVKEAIEARGGSVLVESEPLGGTTFTILMPLTASGLLPDRSAADRIADSKRVGPPLVLVVDDSRTVRQQTLSYLEKFGCRGISAENGAEALELLLSGAFEPDLILSDVEMPQIDGWELLEYIKTDDNLGHIPVVLVTSLDDDKHRERARDLKAADYVVKPLSREHVESVLRRLEIVSVATA